MSWKSWHGQFSAHYSLPLLHITAVLISAYTIFLTGSRGGMVAMVSAALIIFFNVQKQIPISKKIALLVAFIFLVVTVLLLSKSILPESIYERLFSFSLEEGGNNRTKIWARNLPLFYRSPLWGSGWASYWGYEGGAAGCHNVYIEVLVESGIIGFFCLFYPMFKGVAVSMKKGYVAVSSLMACELIVSFFLGAINKRFFWLPFIMCILSIESSNNEVKKWKK